MSLFKSFAANQAVRRGLLAFALIAVAPMAVAADEVGYVKTVKGQVKAERAGGSHPVNLGDALYEGDRLIVASQGSVGISFKDETLVSLGGGSEFLLNRYAYDPTTRGGQVEASILKGTMRFVTGLIGRTNPQAIQVNTPTATMGVRGTDFIVEVPSGN